MLQNMEEPLYIGVSTHGYQFRRIDTILNNADLEEPFGPAYYARLPRVNSPDWHTTYDKYTFRPNRNRLVLFQQPILLKGFPVVDVADESCVVGQYNRMLVESKMECAADILPGHQVVSDKPLTYVFLYELPKFVVKYGDGGWQLKPTKYFSDVNDYLEDNFYSDEAKEQRYRNLAPIDFPDCGIGAVHGD